MIEPNDSEAKSDLFSLHRAKAYTLCRLDCYPQSQPHWDQAIAVALPAATPTAEASRLNRV